MKHGDINATLPDRDKVDSLTLDEAVTLLAEKAAKQGTVAPSRAKRASGAKTASEPRAAYAAAAKVRKPTVAKPAAVKRAPAPTGQASVAARSQDDPEDHAENEAGREGAPHLGKVRRTSGHPFHASGCNETRRRIMANPHGSFIWYELMSGDPDASKKFYDDVVGWKIGAKPPGDMDYRMISAPDGDVGGVLRLTDEMRTHGARPVWLGYFGVDDVDKTVAKITAAGGKILMPAWDIPNVGRIAMVTDPQGMPFYVMRGATRRHQHGVRPDEDGAHQLERADDARSGRCPRLLRRACSASRNRARCRWTSLGDYTFLQHAGIGIGAMMTQSARRQAALDGASTSGCPISRSAKDKITQRRRGHHARTDGGSRRRDGAECRAIRRGRRSVSSRRASSARRSRRAHRDQWRARCRSSADLSLARTPSSRGVVHRSRSDVEVAHAERVRFDERAPRLDQLAHQRREDLLGRDRVLDLHPAAGGAPPDPSSFPRAAPGFISPSPL